MRTFERRHEVEELTVILIGLFQQNFEGLGPHLPDVLLGVVLGQVRVFFGSIMLFEQTFAEFGQQTVNAVLLIFRIHHGSSLILSWEFTIVTRRRPRRIVQKSRCDKCSTFSTF